MLRIASIIAAIAGGLFLSACGGGSESGNSQPPPPPPTGGIEGTGIAVGSIDGFGSIFVNGIEFNTGTAQFLIDGQPGTEAELRIGQVVFVAGTIADDGLNGTAESVRHDSNVEGPIDSIDTATSQLVVVGQPVSVTAQTTFGDVPGGGLAGLNVGDEVNVSGYVASNGSISASRIDLDDTPGGEAEVRGRVASLDLGNLQFMLNTLLVDYSSAMLDGFSGGGPQNGDQVEVHGVVESGTLFASQVELEDGPEVAEGDEAEVEGLITRFVSATDFDVAGFAIMTSATTTYENGTANQLALDILVEVEGVINVNGVLVADRIEFGGDGSIRVDGIVEAVDTTASQFTVMTIPITVNAGTRIEDKSDADLRPFSLANLNVGDYVETRGLLDSSNNVLASRVEREDFESDVTLRGPASAVNDPEFAILAVTVLTSGQTQFSDTSSAEFFANADGRIVEATGTWDGTRLNAQEVRFED